MNLHVSDPLCCSGIGWPGEKTGSWHLASSLKKGARVKSTYTLRRFVVFNSLPKIKKDPIAKPKQFHAPYNQRWSNDSNTIAQILLRWFCLYLKARNESKLNLLRLDSALYSALNVLSYIGALRPSNQSKCFVQCFCCTSQAQKCCHAQASGAKSRNWNCKWDTRPLRHKVGSGRERIISIYLLLNCNRQISRFWAEPFISWSKAIVYCAENIMKCA